MMSYIATATLAVGLLATTPQAPEWQASYGKALQATRDGNQPLLVVLDKPGSEDARVEPALLSEGAISGQSAELLKPYQLCHVDVTSDYGKKVAEVFHAKTFPAVAIIDKTGSVIIHRQDGKVNAASWEKMLTENKAGLRTSAKPVSHVSYKPVDGASYEGTSYSGGSSYCPSCQAKHFN
jgi:hypothetical protein